MSLDHRYDALNGTDPEDHPAHAPPPLIYLAAFLTGAALHLVEPVGIADPSARLLGAALVAAGTLLSYSAVREMRRAGTNPSPRNETPRLIVEGPFRFTRNPLYLSLDLIYAGLSLAAGTLWPLPLLLPLTLYMNRIIRHEERYLEERFGDEYREYRSRVRRWI